MIFIVPHYRVALQQHFAIPWMWRIRCSCGWTAMAGTQDLVLLALEDHLAEEEPFPDLAGEFGIEPEPGSPADLLRKSKGHL